MPPAALTPTRRLVRSRKSRTASRMTSVTGSVAAGATLPVLVLMKSAPASMASQEGAAVDDHVDLVGAGCDGVAGVGELDVEARAAAGERGRDGGDVHATAGQRLRGDGHEVGVDADRRDRRDRGIRRVRAARLG